MDGTALNEHGWAGIEDDLEFQSEILEKVSRTFALTIPQLPGRLEVVVSNAYLLCRIADTIEDCESLPLERKKEFYAELIATVRGEQPAELFAGRLAPLLGGSTIEAEKELVRQTDRVVRITHSFSEEEQQALLRCLRVMAKGMEEFQEGNYRTGLEDLEQLDLYCYHVAGVVGEMLTELFCLYSPEVARHRDKLEKLAVSFGQGLQMTNILKDLWTDKNRDVCWLPRDVFAAHGFDLSRLAPETRGEEGYQAGLVTLIGITLGHLKNALSYTLAIPKSEPGIRRFCLWAIGMAVLTLRKIDRNRGYISGNEVKISRKSVMATIVATNAAIFSDSLLSRLFEATASGLPHLPIKPRHPR